MEVSSVFSVLKGLCKLLYTSWRGDSILFVIGREGGRERGGRERGGREGGREEGGRGEGGREGGGRERGGEGREGEKEGGRERGKDQLRLLTFTMPTRMDKISLLSNESLVLNRAAIV